MHALELDPQESRCHRALALIWLYRREYVTAEMMGVSYLLALRGRSEEALGWMEAAMRLNPFHHTWYNTQRAIALNSLRRYAEAAREFMKIPNPGYWSRARLAACYGLGQFAETEVQTAAVLRLKPDVSTADFLRRDVPLERAEDRELLREGLIKAGVPE